MLLTTPPLTAAAQFTPMPFEGPQVVGLGLQIEPATPQAELSPFESEHAVLHAIDAVQNAHETGEAAACVVLARATAYDCCDADPPAPGLGVQAPTATSAPIDNAVRAAPTTGRRRV
jgi:hypothetical protein